MELVPPTQEQLDKIFKDIQLNTEQHKKDTTALKQWLQTQPHLPHDLEEKMLASFVVGCKNSMERSKLILDAYLTNRTTCPDFYASRDPCDETFRRLGKLVQYFVLPCMTPEGYRVSMFRLKTADMSPADLNLRINAIKVLSSFDVRFLEENYWAGDIMIIDCKHMALKFLQSVLILPLLKKYIHCANQSVPVRYKKIIFINLSSVIEPILSIVKRMLKQKLVKRITTSTEDYPFLFKHLPKDILPNEYGGSAGNVEDLNDAWQTKIEGYRDWFLKDMTRTVDESKRPEKNDYKTKKKELYGVEGSFKSLSID